MAVVGPAISAIAHRLPGLKSFGRIERIRCLAGEPEREVSLFGLSRLVSTVAGCRAGVLGN